MTRKHLCCIFTVALAACTHSGSHQPPQKDSNGYYIEAVVQSEDHNNDKPVRIGVDSKVVDSAHVSESALQDMVKQTAEAQAKLMKGSGYSVTMTHITPCHDPEGITVLNIGHATLSGSPKGYGCGSVYNAGGALVAGPKMSVIDTAGDAQ